ncbi:MAG TPA: MerR family transcriptional regulator [Candidatus Limnocylindrales bacterium]|nr:MerR family transcriptional regulator [Candidatus Limnocylindrales bacterium]
MAPNPDDARYTLTELADLAGVTPRTVRYYLAQGLLPAVGVAGPGAKYDDTHLARLHLIKRLQRAHQPLAEIRNQLDSLDDPAIAALGEMGDVPPPSDSALDYIRRVTAQRARLAAAPPTSATGPLLRRVDRLAAPAVPPPAVPPPPMSAPARPGMPAGDESPETQPRIERSQWERVRLGPDVELHIRRPLPRSTSKRVDRLVEIARDLLEEDPA